MEGRCEARHSPTNDRLAAGVLIVLGREAGDEVGAEDDVGPEAADGAR